MRTLERVRATSWAVVVAPTLGAFLFSADTITIQIANPRIGASLHTGLDGLQWAANGFLLPFCVLLVAAGTLADKLGARRVLLAGIAVFGLGELLGSFAQSIDMLVAGRVLAGVGAAAMIPAGVSALRLQIPERRLAGAMAIWMAGAMTGVACGSVVAGLLLRVTSWRGVLWPLAGAAAVGFVIAAVTLKDVRVERVQKLEAGWNLGFAVGLGGLVWGLIRAGSHGWSSPQALAPIVIGVTALAVTAVLIIPKLRRSAGDLDLPRIGVAIVVVITANFGIVSMVFFLSLWYQQVAGRSALGTAVVLLPFIGLSAAAALGVGPLITRVGAPRMLVGGFVLHVAGLAGLSQLERTTGYGEQVGFLIMVGVGLAATLTALAMVLLKSAPADRGGLMSGLQTSANQTGAVLSIALIGSIIASTIGSSYSDGLAAAGLPRAVSGSVVAELAQGITPTAEPQRRIGQEVFSAAVGQGMLIATGAAAIGLLLSLWLVRRMRSPQPAD